MFKLIVVSALAIACHGFSVPVKTTERTINFILYRTSDVSISTPVATGTFEDLENDILPDVETVFLVHGHQGSGLSSLNPIILRELFASGDELNIIVVNWAEDAAQSYSYAASFVPIVAEELRQFLIAMALLDDSGVLTNPLDQAHIIGFNLGAHIAGIAARGLDRVARITGLDPSGKQWGSRSQRLRADDATYVEVIHTDGTGLLANGLGEAIGTADFFINGGYNQPGCLTHSCCHERAYEVFAASINNVLTGRWCSSKLQITLNTCRGVAQPTGNNDITKRVGGMYRTNTERNYPF